MLTSAAIWLSGTPCSGVHRRTWGTAVRVGVGLTGLGEASGVAETRGARMMVGAGVRVGTARGEQAPRKMIRPRQRRSMRVGNILLDCNRITFLIAP